MLLTACTLSGPDAEQLRQTQVAIDQTGVALNLTQTAMAPGGSDPPRHAPTAVPQKPRTTSTPARTPTRSALATGRATPTHTAQVKHTSPVTATVAPSAVVTSTGKVTGKLFYPGAAIPAMTLYFENITDSSVTQIAIEPDQTTYDVELPTGDYYAYAWLPDFKLNGAYTTCGENSACNTHDLVLVNVRAGQTSPGVDIFDWYSKEPLRYPPGEKPVFGTIAGSVTYPSSLIPAMTVYARNVESGSTYTVSVAANVAVYAIRNLPVGSYIVFAWVEANGSTIMKGIGGSHSYAVSCGLSAGCTDHSPQPVEVRADQTTSGIEVSDWYEQDSVPTP
ncbi:MAG TPA: carboxypeptidase-like regulatory domain-containing protein [Anaerolineae bacterium]|jgi:hypothetical protein